MARRPDVIVVMPRKVNSDVARQAAVFGDSVIRCETRWTGPQCHWFEVCLLRVQCGGTGGGTVKFPNAETLIQIKNLVRHFGSHQPPHPLASEPRGLGSSQNILGNPGKHQGPALPGFVVSAAGEAPSAAAVSRGRRTTGCKEALNLPC